MVDLSIVMLTFTRPGTMFGASNSKTWILLVVQSYQSVRRVCRNAKHAISGDLTPVAGLQFESLVKNLVGGDWNMASL